MPVSMPTRGQAGALALERRARDLGLTKRERLFAEAVASGQTQADAYRAAGGRGKNANVERVRASQLAARPRVQEYMELLRAEAHLVASEGSVHAIASHAEILQRMTQRARAAWSQHLVFPTPRDGEDRGDGRLLEDFSFDLRALVDAGLAHVIEEISFDKEGRPRFKFASSAEADEALARIMGLDQARRPEEDTLRQARAAFRQALAHPDAARGLETFALEVEERRRVVVRRVE